MVLSSVRGQGKSRDNLGGEGGGGGMKLLSHAPMFSFVSYSKSGKDL